MKSQKMVEYMRYGLVLFLLCFWSLPQLAGAVALPYLPVPTGPYSNGPNTVPDYYTTANWANTPPLAKFVDTLPGLGAAKKNNLGQYLSVGKPDTVTYPGSDYYEIDLVEYREQMHSDLPAAGTLLRGYVQVNRGTDSSNCGSGALPACSAANNTLIPDDVRYLGPTIVAQRDRPVRIKFTNRLPLGAAGDLFIPVDTSVMGAGEGPLGPGSPNYTQNRATIHLHGGRTPWISDGTPHQWITPAGENTPYPKGVSVQNVPDMPDPGDGSMTFFYTNQQSARLMFYHDHAFGITRLNVYAGEAAGYVITDKYEQDLVKRGLIPPDQIPLIIQDKTYVNATKTAFPLTGETVQTVRDTDPLWNWGSGALTGNIRTPVDGDLWLPHVYMPAQNSIAGAGGVNPFGRWMYGPWFYPATAVEKGPVANPYYDPNCGSPDPAISNTCMTPGQPVQIPGTPTVSMGMEAFQDSVVVNGTVFPSLTVDPRAYRFRILNAASDRFQNLSFYVADATPGNISPDPRLNAPGRSNRTEVKTVPASAALAAANNWPALWPVDGRDGGVPDPGVCTGSEQAGTLSCPNLGPSFLQIATEGGFLPGPVLRKPQPVTYIIDPTAFWVGIVDQTGLALGPAERADTIVDFSNYAGKTLILYNDAPAAWPARVPGYDYFTGAPDMRDGGGYGAGGVLDPVTGVYVVDPTNPNNAPHGVLPGYAPNTRTVMQVIVRSSAGTDQPYDFSPTVQAALAAEFTAAAAPDKDLNPAPAKTLFERAQEPIIVGQAAYKDAYPNSVFPIAFPWEGIAQINDNYLRFVTLTGQQVTVPFHPKGIHDEMGASFDPVYGRMSGNLAMQLPNPTTLNALLVLYGFSDLPTETISNSPQIDVQVLPVGTTTADPYLAGTTTNLSDGTQIWKISHNGVDTHPIHFHIFDVQLINRVGWDGQIAYPEANELGWKDTVKISPLMDTIVAVRPRAPMLPFGIPNSIRPLNPAIALGSPMGFNSVDWTTGQARVPAVTNILYDFKWEYVWHCHILSHEEMDMMRPIVLHVPSALPNAPILNPVSAGGVLTWTDTTPTPVIDSSLPSNPQNEIGFKIERCSVGCNNPVNYETIATAPANSTTYTDTTAFANSLYNYRVVAHNASGSSASNVQGALIGNLDKPLITIAAPNGTTYDFGATDIRIDAVASATAPKTVARVDYSVNGVFYASNAIAPFSITIANASAGTLNVTARAVDSNGVASNVSNTVTLTVYGVTAAPATITVPAGSSTGAYTVSWPASANAGATYVLEESTDNFATIAATYPTAATSLAFTGKLDGLYYYRVTALDPPNAASATVTGANGCTVTHIAAPAWLMAPPASSNGIYSVNWGASSTPAATYILEESRNGFASVSASYPTAGLTQAFSGKTNGSYSYRVRATVVGATVPGIPTAVKTTVVSLAAARTVSIPDFSQPLLAKESQSPWENIIPNALADYFTYVPFSNADAIALGFPSTCGNTSLTGSPADVASTEDCYTITVRKFPQPLALSGIFGGGSGLLAANGAAAADTFVHGYGSGGIGWTPPGATAVVTGNAPAAFAATGVWHFPAPTIKGTSNRPVRVQWLNELPNEAPTGLDPSVDCGPNAPNCFPYNRIVTHVHGAHVGPESDGLTSAWYTPGFALKGEDFVSTPPSVGPEGTYFYPMDQEAGTIWYHDHAMGTTHNNTNMGMAGFFPVTDANEKALVTAGTLPSGPYELGFALQDRHFTTNGQFAMPDYPIYDRTVPGCVINAVTGLPEPSSCTMLKWMKAADGHFIPYVAGDPLLNNANNKGTPGVVKAPFSAPGAGAPYGATSATLEYFGNMPVVNGVVYGKYNVEPRVYRMRFVGGTDSRTWVLELKRSDTNAVIPLHVIGTDQGLLNAPVSRNELDLMPGERVDVLVDFSGIPAGTRVVMNNLGSDTPWAGYEDYKVQVGANTWVRSADIPEVMAFDVTLPLSGPSSPAPATIASLRTPIVPLTAPANVRNVSLMEITDVYGRTMPTIDSRGFKPVGIPVTEIIKLNDVEQWDIINTTVDAHPMHLHLVAFQLINRQALATDALGNVIVNDPLAAPPVTGGFTPPGDDIINQVFTPPSYTVAPGSTPLPPEAWEMGWKDTITSPPGYVTRVIARFDLAGEYVWHCHILSHEEHDMMRNFIVTDAAFRAPAPASIQVPATSISGSYTVDWVGTAIPGVTYELQEKVGAGAWNTIYTGAAPRFDLINKPAGSYTYQVRANATAGFTTSPWRTGANDVVVARTVITNPANGATLPGTATTIDATVPAAPAGAAVVRVDFSDNGIPVGTATTFPYSVAWVPAGGTHNLVATAYYSNNVSSVSAVVTVTTVAVVPTITMNNPVNGAAFDLGTAIPLAATPSTLAGVNIWLVEFFDGATVVGYDFTPGSPYSFSYTPASASTHNLSAVAYYSNGAVATSAVIPVTVNGTVAAPASITVPATSTTGSYTVSWAPSGTSGVTYTLEESTDNFATYPANTIVVASGSTSTSALIPIKKSGSTYYYRVKAVKIPMSDSLWAIGANGFLVPAQSITTTSLPGTSVNATYSKQIVATGGVKPLLWSATGLPAGLSINTATGLISGILTNVVPNGQISATFSVGITVLDSAAAPTTANTTMNLLVNQGTPSAPTNLVATAISSTQVDLTWTDTSNNESAFQIQRATDNAFLNGLTTVKQSIINSTSYTDTTVAAGTTYYYRIRTLNALAASAFSSNATVTTQAPVLPPVAITTTSLPGTSVNATYSKQIIATGGVQPLLWSAAGLPAGLSINTATGLISGILTNVVPNGQISATFSVVITVLDSAAAPTTANTTMNLLVNQGVPSAPTNLVATAISSTQVDLTWTDTSNNESAFQIQRATDNAFLNGLTTVKQSIINSTSYTDTTVAAGTTYYYRIRTLNAVAGSAFSSNATVNTP